MKLFGNSRGSARSGKHPRNDTEKPARLRKGKIALLVILSILFVIVAALCIFVKFYIKPPEPIVIPSVTIVQQEQNTDSTSNANTETTTPQKNEEEIKPGYYNILLAGTDKDGTRTDTIMIARLDTGNHTVALMSVPRDTLIEGPNGRAAKINSVYGANGCSHEGMMALMVKLEEILGFMPSGYVLVNLDAFMELVDTIGGVYFDVPQRMYHEDPTQNLLIDLYPGYQLLNGNKAMQLVRFRGYAQADIQRTHVQQDFIFTVLKQCIALENWNKISDYIDIFSRNVTSNFTVGNMLYFGQQLMQCDLNDLPSYTLPGKDVWIDASYYDLYEDQVAEIVKNDFTPYVN